MNRLRLEFRRRLPADVIYEYEQVLSDVSNVWKRTDKDLWLKPLPNLGWTCVNENDEVLSIPWPPLIGQHEALPPKGKWVSCKGDKSYVYDLVFL